MKVVDATISRMPLDRANMIGLTSHTQTRTMNRVGLPGQRLETGRDPRTRTQMTNMGSGEGGDQRDVQPEELLVDAAAVLSIRHCPAFLWIHRGSPPWCGRTVQRFGHRSRQSHVAPASELTSVAQRAARGMDATFRFSRSTTCLFIRNRCR